MKKDKSIGAVWVATFYLVAYILLLYSPGTVRLAMLMFSL